MDMASQTLTDAYTRLQSRLGAAGAPTIGGGAFRVTFPNADMRGESLEHVLTDIGAQPGVAVNIPLSDGTSQDLVSGIIDGQAFMAQGTRLPDGRYSVEIRLYMQEKGGNAAKHVGSDAIFLMVDALFKGAPVPPDALTTYLAHRLTKLKAKEGRKFASELMAVLADYLAQ